MTEIRFDDQVAVVTGAGRSLGRSYAMELASRGASVVVNDIGGPDENGVMWADAVVGEIVGLGGTATASYDSVMTPEGGVSLVRTAMEAYGRVDVIVHNAGFLRPNLLESLTRPQIDEGLAIHLLACFNVTQPAWSTMAAQGYGRVVLTSSGAVFGILAGANYVAGKSAVIGLTRALALEGRSRGIRVNCIMPSSRSRIGVDNPNVGADADAFREALAGLSERRVPGAVTPLALYLASDQCEVTGATFSALGGRFARVFLGVTEGWLCPDVQSLTPEDIGSRIEQISGSERWSEPAAMIDEIDEVRRRVDALEPPSRG